MRVLIIDDNVSITRGLIRLLAHHGLTDVTHVTTIATAFSILERQVFDVIVTDNLLPGISGLDGVDFLRTRHSGPIICLSGSGLNVEYQKAFDLYLDKPIDVADLAHHIRTVKVKK